MKLYELTDQYNQLQSMIEDGEVDEQTLQDTLSGIEGEIEDKADNMARMVKNLEANEEALKNEQGRLAHKRLALDNKIANIKNYLQMQMAAMGKEKIKGTIFTVSIQNNPSCLDIEKDDAIPMKYWQEHEPTIDKIALLADMKNGLEVEGVTIKQTKGIRIR